MWKSENTLSTFRGFLRQTTNVYEIDWECPLCLEYRDNHATVMWKCKHTVCLSCFENLTNTQKQKCVICKNIDDTIPQTLVQSTERLALMRYLKDILKENKNTFFWIKINDDLYFTERYKSRYARDNGYALITMTNFSAEENEFFNADSLLEFRREFKFLIRNVRGYAVVQTGLQNHNDIHPEVDEILRIGNLFSLTEGLSDSKVFKI